MRRASVVPTADSKKPIAFQQMICRFGSMLGHGHFGAPAKKPAAWHAISATHKLPSTWTKTASSVHDLLSCGSWPQFMSE